LFPPSMRQVTMGEAMYRSPPLRARKMPKIPRVVTSTFPNPPPLPQHTRWMSMGVLDACDMMPTHANSCNMQHEFVGFLAPARASCTVYWSFLSFILLTHSMPLNSSTLKTKDKDMTYQCKVCKQTFMCTAAIELFIQITSTTKAIRGLLRIHLCCCAQHCHRLPGSTLCTHCLWHRVQKRFPKGPGHRRIWLQGGGLRIHQGESGIHQW